MKLLVGVVVLGLLFIATGIEFSFSRTVVSARRLLRASVLYLPLMLLLSVVDADF